MSSKEVDERVVEMRFDNALFEKNVQTSMSTLDKLKAKLNFNGVSKGLEDVGNATKKLEFSGVASGIEAVQAKLSAMEVIGVTALAIQAFNYAWTINGTGLFILNAGVWTDTTDDYGTTNCAIYVNGACVVANTHRYGESSNSVELDAGATFVYWFVNANNQKVLLQAGSTKTGNKTLTYTVQGLFGLAVT